MGIKPPFRFNRHEIAGAFGDLGTDVPLIALLILTCKLDARSVLVLFGACQVLAGLAYRLPVPVQPLKAMATIAIASGGRITAPVLAGGGLTIGAIMLILTLTGGLGAIARVVPKEVVRGIQLGLGITLAMLALTRYLPAPGLLADRLAYPPVEGYVLGAIGFALIILLRGSRRFPAALVVLGLGIAYSFAAGGGSKFHGVLDLGVPAFRAVTPKDLLTGLVLLAIPQLPLSLGNAVLATRQTLEDLFPGSDVPVRKLGLTYSLCNLVAPLFGGIPICHGSNGVAGHYAFGARTGTAPVIYGTAYLVFGVLFGANFFTLISIFPQSLLGMLLLFEAVALMRLSRDMGGDRRRFFLVLLIGLLCAGLPGGYGFLAGMVIGTALAFWMNRNRRAVDDDGPPAD